MRGNQAYLGITIMKQPSLSRKICNSIMQISALATVFISLLYAFKVPVVGQPLSENNFNYGLIFLFLVIALTSTIKSLMSKRKIKKR